MGLHVSLQDEMHVEVTRTDNTNTQFKVYLNYKSFEMRPSLIDYAETIPEMTSGAQYVLYLSIQKFTYLKHLWQLTSAREHFIAFGIDAYKAQT